MKINILATVSVFIFLSAFVLACGIQRAKSFGAPEIEWSRTYGGVDRDSATCVVNASDGGYLMTGITESFGAGGRDFWLVKVTSSGVMQWNKTVGGDQDDDARCVVVTSDGGYAIAGYTKSFGAGEEDFWLVKVDSSGNHQWNKTYGGIEDLAFSVVEASDGGYALAGWTNSSGAEGRETWLVKVDSSGDHQWNKTYGGAGKRDVVLSIVNTDDGGYALGGYTNSTVAGDMDFWLVKADSSGNHQWNKTYDGTGDDYAFSLVEMGDEGYALAGWLWRSDTDAWLVKVDSSGNHEWNKTYGGSDSEETGDSVVKISDGGYAMAGSIYSEFTSTDYDLLLVKVDSYGNMEWNITYGGYGFDLAHSLLQVHDGGFIISGEESYRSGDFWLVKIEGPPPVGGIQIPINKLALLVQYITSAAIIVVVAAGSVYIGKRWFRKFIALRPQNITENKTPILFS